MGSLVALAKAHIRALSYRLSGDALVPDIHCKPLDEIAVWNPRPGRDGGSDE